MKKIIINIGRLLLLCLILWNYSYSQNTWQQLPGPAGGIVRCLSQSNNFIFAGTLDGGAYMSSDFGDNWSYIGDGLPFLDVEKILYNNNRIFIVNSKYGIYISDDFGQNWIEQNKGIKNIAISAIVELDGQIFCSSLGAGVYYSTNNGDTWIERNDGLANKTVNNLYVFRSVIYSATNQGVYESGNKGERWTAIKSDGIYYHVAVNEENIFIATNYQVWLTSDHGGHWDRAEYGYGLGSGIIYSLYSTGPYVIAGRSNGLFFSTFSDGLWVNIISAFSKNRVYTIYAQNNFFYAGTSKGFFYSNDYGVKWKESNSGLLNERVLSMIIDNNKIYAGLLNNGLAVSSDNGVTWEEMGIGNKKVPLIYKDGNNIFVSADDTLYLTTNYGLQWSIRDYGLVNIDIHCMAKLGSEYLIGTSDGVYTSTNSGYSWTVKTSDFRGVDIRKIFVDKNNHIYLATESKILLSRDNGKTWLESYSGMKSYSITTVTGDDSLLVAGSMPETLYDADVYMSKDGGRNWTTGELNLHDSYIKDISVSGENIFISLLKTSNGENHGVMYSSNSGKSWNDFNLGVRVKGVEEIEISNNKLFIGTYGAGIYTMDVPEALHPPEILSPINNSKDVYPETVLDWQTVESSEYYTIQISDNFNKFEKNIIYQSSSTISEFKVPSGILAFGTKYYWRVNFTKSGRNSDWTEIFAFTTEQDIPTIVTLINPVRDTIGISVLTYFLWNAIAEAGEYNIQVSKSIDFDILAIDVTIGGLTGNFYTATKGLLEFDAKYYWRVRANIHNVLRGWSDVWAFTTGTLNLTPPTLLSPFDKATDLSFAIPIEWEAIADADEYIIQVAKDNAFADIVVNDTINKTIINLDETVLDYDTEYFWRVKSKFMTYESPWSEIRSFKTAIKVNVEDEMLLNQVSIKINPNPVSDEMTISYIMPFNTNYSIFLTDINGYKVKQLISENEYQYWTEQKSSFSLKDLSNGLYFLTIETGYGNKTIKFVLNR